MSLYEDSGPDDSQGSEPYVNFYVDMSAFTVSAMVASVRRGDISVADEVGSKQELNNVEEFIPDPSLVSSSMCTALVDSNGEGFDYFGMHH